MSLTKEQINKIKFDALVQKRLRLLQDIANREASIRRWEEIKDSSKVSADPMKPLKMKRAIDGLEDQNEDDEALIKVVDKMVDEYGKSKDKKGA